jgi:hypothetical protein
MTHAARKAIDGDSADHTRFALSCVRGGDLELEIGLDRKAGG